MTRDDANMAALNDQLDVLKEMRRAAEVATPTQRRYKIRERVVRLEWEAATSDIERRAVLIGQIGTMRIVRGETGRRLDPTRVQITWKPAEPDLGMADFVLG